MLVNGRVATRSGNQEKLGKTKKMTKVRKKWVFLKKAGNLTD